MNSLDSYKWIRRVDAIIATKWRPDFFNPDLSNDCEGDEISLDIDLFGFLALNGPTAITDQETMETIISNSSYPSDKKMALSGFCQNGFKHLLVFSLPK